MRLLMSTTLLGLAWFAAMNVVWSFGAWAVARSIGRRPDCSASALLTIRLLPAAAATFFVVAMFLPAHWRFEPARTEEEFGVLIGVMAFVGAGLLARAILRAARMTWRDHRLRALTRRTAAPLEQGGFEVGGLPGVSLAGILRPAILVGSDARAALTPAELDLAISHEVAHSRSRDNLKRFLIFCAPDVFGWCRAAREIEDRWQAESECDADAHAVAGDDARAAVLASALVKVARLARRQDAIAASPAWSAFHVAGLLEIRVRRLVGGSVAPAAGLRRLGVALALLALGITAGVSLTDLSYGLHAVTEILVTSLP
jgi:beta-lactamase regulating signal transducer with metallopeptidase domain